MALAGSRAGGFGVLVVALAVAAVSLLAPRNRIPDHMLNHKLVDLQDFFTEGEVDELLQFTRQMSPIPPLAREYDSYTPMMDNIGEAVPYNGTKPCPLFMIPSAKKDRCIFPGRIDVGRHFIMTGGPGALKERYETMITRVYGFMKYIYNFNEYPTTKKLLESPKFMELATAVCPDGKTKLDPIQVNLVVQLPGQTVATHVDGVYFQRASRFHYPQWLGAAMLFSGLFQDDFINQVQVVGYYHKWTDTNRSGVFKFWNSKDVEPQLSFPVSRSANAVDGSKVVHAADVYMPDHLPPKMADSSANTLNYNAETKLWDMVGADGTIVESYSENDIRFSVVYRARCFRDQAEIDQYRKDQENPMPLEEIFATFRKDLLKRGKLKEGQELGPYEFGVLLLDTYVKYPLSAGSLIPYNWCALDRQLPSLTPLVKLICK
mmetsp:Transcript_64331/g.119579  ORF Transcript_64331/g.119579 Transcript_64331/m.119579 type:complete len:433 (-) Transcript_64331:52-1350(-)